MKPLDVVRMDPCPSCRGSCLGIVYAVNEYGVTVMPKCSGTAYLTTAAANARRVRVSDPSPKLLKVRGVVEALIKQCSLDCNQRSTYKEK